MNIVHITRVATDCDGTCESQRTVIGSAAKMAADAAESARQCGDMVTTYRSPDGEYVVSTTDCDDYYMVTLTYVDIM